MKMIKLDGDGLAGMNVDEKIARLTPVHDVRALCLLSQQIPDGNILEIGCNKGLTTRDLANMNPRRHIHAVDYDGKDSGMDMAQRGEKPPLGEIGIYARELGLKYDNVTFYNQKSETLSYELFSPISMIFIDGDHSYRGVKADTEKALDYYMTAPGVKPVIVWHDYYEKSPEWCAVKKYIDSEVEPYFADQIAVIEGTWLCILNPQ